MNSRMDSSKLNIGTYCLAPCAQTEEHVRDIAACGVDFVESVPYDLKLMDLFAKYGLGAIVTKVAPPWWGGNGDRAGKMAETCPLELYDKAAAAFTDHPAIWGIDIGDEPSALDFPHYGKVVERVKELFPNQFPYLNLYPNYASVAANDGTQTVNQLGTQTYGEHIAAYVKNVNLPYICYDFYVYSCNVDKMHDNFKCVADACARSGRKFWYVLQVNSNTPEEKLSVNQLRYQANLALAYGAETLLWACWTKGWWHNNVLDENGVKTEQYEKLKKVNAELHAMGETYMKYRRVATRFVELAPAAACGVTSLVAEDNAFLVVGEMEGRADPARKALFVVAADDPYDKRNVTHEILFDADSSVKVSVTGATGPVPVAKRPDGKLSFSLDSNAAAMICTEPADVIRRPHPRSLKVLMIGNSFSICVLREMPSVAKSMGLDLDLTSMYIGGCSFERHWDNLCSDDPEFKPYGHERNVRGETLFMDQPANLLEVLKSDTWDVITLQQASHFSWCPETYRPFADNIVARLRELQPQAEIVIQETWSYTPWDKRLAQWGITADEMYEKLHRAYWDYANENGFRVIPTGTAVQLYRRRLPVVYAENSFGGDPCGGRWGGEFVRDENGKWGPGPGLDVFHLGYDGEYLQALVWTGTLFGVDVSKCPYVPDYVTDPVRADKMRECAQTACLAAAANAVDAPEVDFGVAKGAIKALHGVNNAPMRIPEGSKQGEFQAAGIPYVRTHDTAGMWGGGHYVDIPNIFPDFDADENDPASYDFAFTDAFLKPLVEAGCEPFYRLGVTIENYWRIKAYRIAPPEDFAKWARICEHVVRHYNEGWANGFKWNLTYWEIWNEPENPPMWSGTREQYYELYRVAANHLKTCFPGIKVGGYGGCGFYAVDDESLKDNAFMSGFVSWFEDFVKFVQAPETKCPLDFYSWHLYVDGKWTIKRIGVHADYVRRVLDEGGLKDTESIFNEWNIFAGWAHQGFVAIKEPPVAARVAAAFALMQDGSIDKAMYYDALPTRSYCGLFYFPSFATTPTYEAFRAFNVLYRLGNSVKVTACADDIYTCAAAGDGDKAILIANASDKSARLVPQIKGADGVVFRLYRLDGAHRGLDLCGDWREGDLLTLPKDAFVLLSTRDPAAPTAPSALPHALNGIDEK